MLREARESRGMTIEQLSSVTRINVKFIEALESGRRDRLPGQVYLKPFVKTCAEALDLDLKELYRAINGESGGESEADLQPPVAPPGKKRFDYKLPVVLLIAVIVCVVIYLALNAREKIPEKTKISEVVPAEATKTKKQAMWSRPWERPSVSKAGGLKQNLILLAKDSVGVLLLAGGDTVFNGIMTDGDRKVFSSKDDFVVSLTRNERMTGFLNGRKDVIIGSSQGKLENYRMGKEDN